MAVMRPGGARLGAQRRGFAVRAVRVRGGCRRPSGPRISGPASLLALASWWPASWMPGRRAGRPAGPGHPRAVAMAGRDGRCARTSSVRRLNVTLLSLAFAISLVLGRLVQLQGVDAVPLPLPQPQGARDYADDTGSARRDRQQRRHCPGHDHADRHGLRGPAADQEVNDASARSPPGWLACCT